MPMPTHPLCTQGKNTLAIERGFWANLLIPTDYQMFPKIGLPKMDGENNGNA